MNVNIYIETAYSGPAKRRMAGPWMAEYLLQSGKPITRGGIIYADIITENEMALRLLQQALSILTKTCCVRVFTTCTHILNTMENHWLWQWQGNGWKNARGKQVGNMDLWQQCAALLEQHIAEWTDEEHSYRQCMRGRIKKEMERDHELKEPENYLAVEVPEWNTGKGDRRHAEKGTGSI